ncbi:ribonucleotide-diphosphate reductase subunit beta [Chlamydia crocodili]|uniref:Ribonucleoside-diphosphate reductase subunit beta n=1 Tax=Chlamydia crocodili TaxID=2766982 RepID=A0ABX8CFS5_9CHLA|nr:ribonucleotide-diphosphate reductase subunit beta [Chlamydia crocodili]QVE49304.1 ribonucleotide-diphosphate reductase subunit beta [Chlamydia crocodili]
MEADILDGKSKRVQLNSKRLVNCNQVDVNQLVPIKYKWAWEHYLNGCANNWLPTEVPMARDIELWKSNDLSEDERRVILLNLGFFSTAESLVGNNIVLAIFKHITNPEARQYLLRQAFEEAVHTHTFLYICESLGLDEAEVFNAYNERATIKAKDDFQMTLTGDVLDPNFSTDSVEGLRQFIKNLVGYYIIMEGIFFYSGFVMILSFHRQNKMTGIGEQYQYILRDETIHLNFGIDLINGIKEENPEIWSQELQDEIVALIQEAVDLEIEYARDCLPRGILGLKSSMFIDYVRHIADRRLERIGLKPIYNSRNPFPWMSETIDLNKEKNFFETRVTEYQTSANLNW